MVWQVGGGSMEQRGSFEAQSQLETDTPDIIDLLPTDGSAGQWAIKGLQVASIWLIRFASQLANKSYDFKGFLFDLNSNYYSIY